METLNYLVSKFHFNVDALETGKMPIEIPDFGRDKLASLFYELGFKTGAEIGVESGVYSEILLRANPNLTLYSIDPWKAYRGYRDHTRQAKLDRFYEETKTRLRPFEARSAILRGFSMEAINGFDDNSLDFVYIDANHKFVEVANDIHYWLRKVRSGGILSGHDYTRYKNAEAEIHVHQVVNGYTDAYRIRPWFVLGTNAEVPGQVRDVSRSWVFVKV